jgi:L-fuconolactonase
MTIDAHHHLWRYRAGEYEWIGDDMGALRRDFLPADFAAELNAAGVAGSVAVQARQTLEETDALLQFARSFPFIQGVVGWAPLADFGARIGGVLDRWAGQARLRGLRHVLQAEPEAYFDHPGFNLALREVAARGLSYDLLIHARQLPKAIGWADRHPKLTIILDHLAKPPARGAPPEEWRRRLRELAQRQNVFCKFSGLVTEVPGWNWAEAQLRPYFEVALEAFGPKRLMFGSDWPVCLLGASYGRWHSFVAACAAPLTGAEREGILGATCAHAYGLAGNN